MSLLQRARAESRGLAVLAVLLAVPVIGAAATSPAPVGFPETNGERVLWRPAGPLLVITTSGRAGSTSRAATDAELDGGALALAAGDTLGAWAARSEDSSGPAVALREYARACAARGLNARADSLLASPRLAASCWAWDALRLRSELAIVAGDTIRADSLLASAPTANWPGADRAAWLLRRARVAALRADARGAEELARQIVRAYPALGAAGPALALLDSLATARGDSIALADERAGAEVDFFRGARGSAARRLRHARPREAEPERWKLALRLAEVLRASRMPKGALAAADTALALAPAGEARVRADLERTRALRDAGETDAALVAFARIGRSSTATSLRETAWWEYAREAEDESRWPQALEGLQHVARSGGRRADDARVRAGLVQFAHGRPDSARYWWRASTSEDAKFWLGVSLRATNRAAGDSLLAELATLPGYAYYRAAARETLGISGWRHAVVAYEWDPEFTPWLSAWGIPDEELRELGAKLAASRPTPAEWLAAAATAFRLGRTAQGTRWAESATVAAAPSPDESHTWAIVAWAYPPAFEAEVVAAESLGIDRTLLWALIRQESRFDPRARSRSDALGLTQLKVSTAGDAAGWLREPKPREETLFAPDTSVRLGARYLARMLERFGGVTSVALAAYNAGPGTIRDDWRALLERGGEALYAEFASNADSQDYVKRILGFRQAYREMRPTLAP